MKKLVSKCCIFKKLLMVGISFFCIFNITTINTKALAQESVAKKCNGINLNTNVPFIGNCITIEEKEETLGTGAITQTNAFPILMGGLTKIAITLIFAIAFLMVIIGGVLMIIGGADGSYYKKGVSIIKTVAITIAIIGSSGAILRLINPNFFGI